MGDSITYGATIRERAANCYPKVSGGLLGAKYSVRNFRVNGATLLKKLFSLLSKCNFSNILDIDK